MKLKGILCGVIIGVLLASGMFVLAEETLSITPNPFKITVNGVEKKIEGYNINGSTYFKLRDIGNEVGFSVDFKDDTIMITGDSKIATTKSDNLAPGKEVVDGKLYYWCSTIGDLKLLNNTFIKVSPVEPGDYSALNIALCKKGTREIIYENIGYLIISGVPSGIKTPSVLSGNSQ